MDTYFKVAWADLNENDNCKDTLMNVYKILNRGDSNTNCKFNLMKLVMNGYKLVNAILTEKKI